MEAPGTSQPEAPPPPGTTPTYAAPAPQRSGTPWGKILGFGCAGCGCLSLIAVIIGFFAYRAFQKTPLPPGQQAYVGEWRGADGTIMTIRADGSGSLQAGSLSVTNGQVTVDETARTLRIAAFSFGRIYRIDSPPAEGGAGMTLEGVSFTRSGVSSTPPIGNIPGGYNTPGANMPGDPGTGNSPSTDDDPPAAGIPSEDELRRMVTRDLLAFNKAVQDEDFTAFYGTLSGLWQGQTTPGRLQEIFQDFIEKDIDIAPIERTTPIFDSPALVDTDDRLVVVGHYPTAPSVVRFTMKYIKESDEWKLVGINVNVGP